MVVDVLYGWNISRLTGLRTLNIGPSAHHVLDHFLPFLLCKVRRLHLETISIHLSFDTMAEFTKKYHALAVSLADLVDQNALKGVRIEYSGSLPLFQAGQEVLRILDQLTTEEFKFVFAGAAQ